MRLNLFSLAGVTNNVLSDRDAREKWEGEFNTLYIEPVILGNLEEQIKGVVNLIDKDYHQGNGDTV